MYVHAPRLSQTIEYCVVLYKMAAGYLTVHFIVKITTVSVYRPIELIGMGHSPESWSEQGSTLKLINLHFLNMLTLFCCYILVGTILEKCRK